MADLRALTSDLQLVFVTPFLRTRYRPRTTPTTPRGTLPARARLRVSLAKPPPFRRLPKHLRTTRQSRDQTEGGPSVPASPNLGVGSRGGRWKLAREDPL